MYASVAAATDALTTALRGVDGVRFYRQLGGAVDPPAVVLPIPRLVMGRMDPEPVEATYQVGLVADNSEWALETFIQPIVAALEGVTDAVVGPIDPGTYPGGSVQLPAYLITVEVAL
jgi:hypothetical protein